MITDIMQALRLLTTGLVLLAVPLTATAHDLWAKGRAHPATGLGMAVLLVLLL